MSIKLYLLQCQTCDYKRFTDGSDISDLTEIVTCKSCGGAKKFKCPRCGRLIKTKKIQVPGQSSSPTTQLGDAAQDYQGFSL